MKSIRKRALLCLKTMALAGLLLTAAPRLAAQQDSPPIIGDADDKFNPAPCDFNDAFYTANGIDLAQLNSTAGQRFGNAQNGRQTGPPARGNQKNWVVDTTCATTDPTRRNVRILATTAGYVDDGTGAPTDFISILAFLTNQNFFLPANQSGGAGNARGITMEDIVGHFEAYAALKQIDRVTGVFHTTPCGTMGDPTQQNNCFSVASVATPNLRQDWRFATNRNAIDGSDGNCVNPDPHVCGDGATPPNSKITDSPFGYFCDDLLGMWVITYFWFTDQGFGPNQTAVCKAQLADIASRNGLSLDGTPIVKTADELNVQLEANGCGAEGQEDVGGADFPAAIWLICPAIQDPRAGAIAPDAFVDQVRKPNGFPLDINFTINFLSLQIFGVFPNELTSSQRLQLSAAAASAN